MWDEITKVCDSEQIYALYCKQCKVALKAIDEGDGYILV